MALRLEAAVDLQDSWGKLSKKKKKRKEKIVSISKSYCLIENEWLLRIQLNKQASFVLLTESQQRCMCWHVVFAFCFRWRKGPEAPLRATL